MELWIGLLADSSHLRPPKMCIRIESGQMEQATIANANTARLDVVHSSRWSSSRGRPYPLPRCRHFTCRCPVRNTCRHSSSSARRPRLQPMQHSAGAVCRACPSSIKAGCTLCIWNAIQSGNWIDVQACAQCCLLAQATVYCTVLNRGMDSARSVGADAGAQGWAGRQAGRQA